MEHISRPFLDRIDLCAEVGIPSYEDLREAPPGESSAMIRERVARAAAVQQERYKGTNHHFNGELSGEETGRWCVLDSSGEKLLKAAYQKFSLTGRGCMRVLKVARTIADLEGSENIREEHLMEALGFRMADLRLWGQEGGAWNGL